MAHGPHNDTSFLFINSTGGPDDDYSSAYARILAPAYQNSNVDCVMRFYYYFNGSAGGALLEIGIQEDELDIPLDFLHLDAITTPEWYVRVVGIGRKPGHIQVLCIYYNSTQTDYSIANILKFNPIFFILWYFS